MEDPLNQQRLLAHQPRRDSLPGGGPATELSSPFHVRLTPEQRAILDSLAEKWGNTPTHVLRFLIDTMAPVFLEEEAYNAVEALEAADVEKAVAARRLIRELTVRNLDAKLTREAIELKRRDYQAAVSDPRKLWLKAIEEGDVGMLKRLMEDLRPSQRAAWTAKLDLDLKRRLGITAGE